MLTIELETDGAYLHQTENGSICCPKKCSILIMVYLSTRQGKQNWPCVLQD